jgi:trk system potassium uptake protein TrkA
MASAIEFPQVLASLPLAGSDIILFELPLDARSTVTGKTIAEVANSQGFPKECLFIGLIDGQGKVQLPTGQTMLKAGHTAILVAHRQQLDAAVEILTAQPALGEAALGLVTSLRRIDFLSPLSNEEIADLARGIELKRKPAGDTVFRKGDPGESFYLVLSGEITLGDGSTVLERVRAGGFFGEVSLLTGEPRSTSATAATESELAAIPRAEFRRVLMANPAMALDMSRILSQRLAASAKEKKRGLWGR